MPSPIVGQGTQRDKRSIPLATREGNWIPNERRREAPPEKLKASIEIFKGIFPGIILRSLTEVYDCMGMVFASRRTWIDIDCLHFILKDDGYRELAGLAQAKVGDIVVYQGTDGVETHIGIINSKTPKFLKLLTAEWDVSVISKWGGNGEYIHGLEEVPTLYGKPKWYYTDRCLTP